MKTITNDRSLGQRERVNHLECLILVSCLVLLLSLFVASASAEEGKAEYDFHIETQTLGQALDAMVQLTHFQLLYPHELADSTGLNPVVGRYTIGEALSILLSGTGFSGGLSESGVIVVSLKEQPQEVVKEMKKSKKGFLATLISMFSAAASGVALAEEGVDQSRGIEEVLVTAERVGSKSTLDTPLAISAITGDKLEELGIGSASELLNQTPAVATLDNVGGGTLPQIRGVGVYVGDPTVGYYLDDFAFSNITVGFLPELTPFDLDRVEILKGPQGTLYGASSQGGTIRVLTKNPVMNEVEAKVDTTYSSTAHGGDNWQVQGAVNLPLIEDMLAVRLVASQTDNDGWIDLPLAGESDFNKTEKENYRAKVLFTPTDDLSIQLSHWKSDITQEASQATEDYTRSDLVYELNPITGQPTGVVTAANGDDFNSSVEFDVTSLVLEYESENFSLRSATSLFNITTFSQLPLGGTYYTSILDGDAVTEELTLSFTASETLFGTVGLFYSDNEHKGDTVFTSPYAGFGLVDLVYQDRSAAVKQKAIFGEVHYLFSDEFELTLGGRYFEEDRSEEDESALVTSLLSLAGIPSAYEQDQSSFDWRVNLAYTPDEDSLYYLNVATGFKSGLAQPGSSLAQGTLFIPGGVPVFTDPEELISYEIGTKLSFMDDTVILESAIYYQEWSDIITLISVPGGPSGRVGYILNGGDASGYGGELGVTYMVTDELTLQAGFAFNEFEYDDGLLSAGIRPGDTTIQNPDMTYNLSATYITALGDSGMDLFAYLGANHISPKPDYSPAIFGLESDNVTFVNARIGVERDSWGLYLFADNLTEEDGASSVRAGERLAGIPDYRARPRTVGLNFKWKL